MNLTVKDVIRDIANNLAEIRLVVRESESELDDRLVSTAKPVDPNYSPDAQTSVPEQGQEPTQEPAQEPKQAAPAKTEDLNVTTNSFATYLQSSLIYESGEKGISEETARVGWKIEWDQKKWGIKKGNLKIDEVYMEIKVDKLEGAEFRSIHLATKPDLMREVGDLNNYQVVTEITHNKDMQLLVTGLEIDEVNKKIKVFFN